MFRSRSISVNDRQSKTRQKSLKKYAFGNIKGHTIKNNNKSTKIQKLPGNSLKKVCSSLKSISRNRNKIQKSFSYKKKINDTQPRKKISDYQMSEFRANPEIQTVDKQYLYIKQYLPIPLNRARMIDWLLDVCAGFGLKWEVYWSAVQIFDMLIQEGYICQSNVHLVGTTCLFISDKFFSFRPISIGNVIEKAVHNVFTEKQVLNEEIKIMQKIGSLNRNFALYQSIYTQLRNNFPNLKRNDKLQIMKQLCLIWMNPLEAFLGYQTMEKISYEDLIELVVRSVKFNQSFGSVDIVAQKYLQRHVCDTFNNPNKMGSIQF